MNLLKNLLPGAVFFVLIVYGIQVTPVRAMSLEECVNVALKNNPDLQKQQLTVHAADSELKDTRSQNFGRFDLITTYTHYNLPRTLTPLTPAIMSTDPAAVPTTQDLLTSGIVYELPLFTGFAATRAVEIADLQRQMAATALQLSREQLIYNVRTIYINILSLQAQARAQAAYGKALQRLYDDIKRELKLGRKARIDELKAAADLENAHAVETRIAGNISILKTSLAVLLNIDDPGELEEIDLSPEAMAEVHETFLDRLPELTRMKNARLAVEKSEKIADRASGALYPQLLFSSAYGWNYGPNDSSNRYSWEWEQEEVWQAGLSLRWNIFDFGGSRAKVQKARIEARQSAWELTRTELELKKNLHEAISNINTAFSDYTSARTETNMTRETAQIEQVRFDQGAADINDLLYARARNLLAESRFIDASYKYKTARFYLDYLLEQGDRQ